MSFTEVFPGRMSLPDTFLVLHSKQESSCVYLETHPQATVLEEGGMNPTNVPFWVGDLTDTY